MMYKQTADYLNYSKNVTAALQSHPHPTIRTLAEADMSKDTRYLEAPVNKLQFAVWDNAPNPVLHHKKTTKKVLHAIKDLEHSLSGGEQEQKLLAKTVCDLMNDARDKALGTGRG